MYDADKPEYVRKLLDRLKSDDKNDGIEEAHCCYTSFLKSSTRNREIIYSAYLLTKQALQDLEEVICLNTPWELVISNSLAPSIYATCLLGEPRNLCVLSKARIISPCTHGYHDCSRSSVQNDIGRSC